MYFLFSWVKSTGNHKKKIRVKIKIFDKKKLISKIIYVLCNIFKTATYDQQWNTSLHQLCNMIWKKIFSFTNIFLFAGEIIHFYQHKEVKVSYHL